MTLGEHIRSARLATGRSQQEIASHLGVTQQTISNWEERGIIPDGRYYQPLADVLDLDLTVFLRWVADAHRERSYRLTRKLDETRRDRDTLLDRVEQQTDRLEAILKQLEAAVARRDRPVS